MKLFLPFVLLSVAVAALGYWVDESRCASRGRLMGEDYSYGPIQGCMVKYQRRWLPIEAIRDVGLGGAQ